MYTYYCVVDLKFMPQCWRDYLDMFLWFYFFEWMLSIGRKVSIPFYRILSQVLRGVTIGITINLAYPEHLWNLDHTL